MSSLFVTCIPGLEPLLAAEIERLGFSIHPGSGGVFVSNTDMETILTLNYHLRLAHRVLLPLASFPCKTKKDLYEASLEVDWVRYFEKGWTLAVDANGVSDELRNTHFTALVVKDAVCDRLSKERGVRPSVSRQKPDVQLNLHIHRNQAVLYYDTSGVPLYKRAYRRETVRAPVQESVAAAILEIAGYTGEESLCDPCCGSGTFLIEAAMRAAHLPAGFFRTQWGFQRLPQFDPAIWKAKRAEWDLARKPLSSKIMGIDQSAEVMAACRANLRAAGFSRKVELYKDAFQGRQVLCELVVTNPPYGMRLQDKLTPLYRDLGTFVLRSGAPTAYVLTGWEEGGRALGLPVVQAAPLLNGGLPCTVFEVEAERAHVG